MLVFSARKPQVADFLRVAGEVVVGLQFRHAHQRGAAHAVGAEMRPIDRNALADRAAEQRGDGDAIGLAGDVQQGILDGGDGLLVEPAAGLAREDVKVLGHLLEPAGVTADQDRLKGP